MATYDNNRDGCLDWQEFLIMYNDNKNKFKNVSNNEENYDSLVYNLFILYDTNHNNKIEYSELRHLLQSAGWEADENTTARMVFFYHWKIISFLNRYFYYFKLASYDSDRDGTLNLQEFATLYRQNKKKLSNIWGNFHYFW